MKRNTSPRAAFIAEMQEHPERLAGIVYDALALASTHDPDHNYRISILERQMYRIGAPQYRHVGPQYKPRK